MSNYTTATELLKRLNTLGINFNMFEGDSFSVQHKIGERLRQAIKHPFNEEASDDDAKKLAELLGCKLHITVHQNDHHLSYDVPVSVDKDKNETFTLRLHHKPGHWYCDTPSGTSGQNNRCLFHAVTENLMKIMQKYKADAEIASTQHFAASHPDSTKLLNNTKTKEIDVDAVIAHQTEILKSIYASQGRKYTPTTFASDKAQTFDDAALEAAQAEMLKAPKP